MTEQTTTSSTATSTVSTVNSQHSTHARAADQRKRESNTTTRDAHATTRYKARHNAVTWGYTPKPAGRSDRRGGL